ncbi:P22AR C-terminal domain-containing protein [Escherichia coli]|uniref:P22AR C-terminal domain-containing protein n=2 Tax=Escherichia coli TaxID=562 RepID=UPI000E4460BA|nr:P22AR C-terminal domain-containing protein [Escherichia coli]RGO40209.1 phage repressor protein/antirepressor Ant [Escherichia coli]
MKSIAKAQNDFTIFKFGDSEIRVINKCGEPWFVAKDVCDALNLTNSRKALTALDDDEKGVTLSYTLGGEQNLSIVSESGMYTLVLRCRDAVNKGSVPHKFRKWVTAEVLPSIRKTGSYGNTLKAKKALPGKITTEQQEAIKQLVMSRGQSLPKEKQAKAMITMWSSLKSHFGCSYKEISEEQFTEALSLAARVPLEGELIGKQEKSTNELSAKEANNLVWLWDYANRSQALFRELYPALKLIQSGYSGICHDYGYEFSYTIGRARGVLINHTRDIDIYEPDGPTNLLAWERLKNKELPPSLHRY